MIRTLAKILFAVALSLGCLSSTAFAQPPVGQQAAQYTDFTLQSVPQMLQQGGYQITPKTDAIGTYWLAANPQSGKMAVIEPKTTQGNNIKGLLMSATVAMLQAPLTNEQTQAINAKLMPTHSLTYNAQTRELRVCTNFNEKDSNSQELRQLIETLFGKADLVNQMLGNQGQAAPIPAPVPVPAPAPAPIPAPVVMPNLVNTTWNGSENLGGYGKLSFQFKANGQAVMIDAKNTIPGTYTVNGNQVTIALPGAAVYQGTVNGNVFSGTGKDNTRTWTFSVNLSR